jgi:hypothetical protein
VGRSRAQLHVPEGCYSILRWQGWYTLHRPGSGDPCFPVHEVSSRLHLDSWQKSSLYAWMFESSVIVTSMDIILVQML